jgi:exodeoxyribonuclease-3
MRCSSRILEGERCAERGVGLASAYHALRSEQQGQETVPTHYWRDRKKDGPTYHIDYVFLLTQWLGGVRELAVGSFEGWCGSGLSDHVPILVDVNLQPGTMTPPVRSN